MRKIFIGIIFLLFPLLGYSNQDIPQITSGVNDFSGILDPEYTKKINIQVEEFKKTKNIDISVVTVATISIYTEDEYTNLLWKNWESVQKKKAVLILLAVKERRWRLDVGRIIKGGFSNNSCNEIGNNYMVPYFKDAKYGEGLYQGILQLSKAVSAYKDIEVKVGGINQPDSSHGKLILFLGVFLTGGIFFCISKKKEKCSCSSRKKNTKACSVNKENNS